MRVRSVLEIQAAICDFVAVRGFKRSVRILISLSIFFCAATSLRAETSVEIDLQEQMAYLLQNGRPVLASPISSGRYGISPEPVHSRSSRKSEHIIPVCMARSLTGVGTRS